MHNTLDVVVEGVHAKEMTIKFKYLLQNKFIFKNTITKTRNTPIEPLSRVQFSHKTRNVCCCFLLIMKTLTQQTIKYWDSFVTTSLSSETVSSVPQCVRIYKAIAC